MRGNAKASEANVIHSRHALALAGLVRRTRRAGGSCGALWKRCKKLSEDAKTRGASAAYKELTGSSAGTHRWVCRRGIRPRWSRDKQTRASQWRECAAFLVHRTPCSCSACRVIVGDATSRAFAREPDSYPGRRSVQACSSHALWRALRLAFSTKLSCLAVCGLHNRQTPGPRTCAHGHTLVSRTSVVCRAVRRDARLGCREQTGSRWQPAMCL